MTWVLRLLAFCSIPAKDLRDCYRFFLPNPVTQPVRGSDPEVVALKVDRENVVVRWSTLNRYVLNLAIPVAHHHLRRMGIECRPIHRPICAIVVSQSFIGREPCAIAIDG